jgi:hypothetical protein
MTGFQNKIATVMTQDFRRVTVVDPITYIASDGRVFVIPRGATSDLTSTPPEIWPFYPPFGEYALAAVLHDCAYQNTLLLVNDEGTAQDKAGLTKDECDLLFKEAMESLRVVQTTVDKIYWGVSVGGWKAFKDDRA